MKLITTVGTSLVTNVINPLRNKCNLSKDEKQAIEAFSKLQQKDYEKKSNFLSEYNFLKEFILKSVDFSVKTSAEMKSIIAIKENTKFKNQNFKVEPIATDTILSPLCAEVLKELIEDYLDIQVNFGDKNIIKDLQVGDYERYKKGLINLLNRLNQFANNGLYFNDMILNITGGFKGVIPYLTIFGQVNDIPIYYIFEFTNSLISIPQIPITIDKNIFEKYWKTFYRLSKEDILDKKDISFEFIESNKSILEIDGDMISLNVLGRILWDRYEKDNLIFYTTNEIFEEIKKQQDIKAILASKFKEAMERKTEAKGGHLVYDDGKNPNRIFYFEDGNNLYIYKTFQNHDKYERYINDYKLDRKTFMQDSKIVKL